MISPVQIGTRLVEMTGAASAYFHRLLNEIVDTLNGVSGSSGIATVTPNGSGIATIAHGYSVNAHPALLERSSADPTGETAFRVQMVSVDADSLTIKLFTSAGVAITSGSYAVAWRVGG